MLKKRVNLFGIFIDRTDLDGALSLAGESVSGGEKPRAFFTPNLEMLSGAYRSEGVRKILNGADVSLPDGFGVRVVAKLLGEPMSSTVAGIDFGEALLAYAARDGVPVFLLGGREGVAQRAAEALCEKYKGLNVCGTYHGYFTDSELSCVCDMIKVSGAEILVVCRGFPRQEKFVCENRSALPSVKVFACLGGSLDVWAGDVKRAPRAMRKTHTEWLWRIANEPERISRFIASLDVLAAALAVFLKRIISPSGIKTQEGEYN